MRKIIDGKIYDTETATEIGEGHYGYRGDFRFHVTSLYRTPRGRWFIAGHGGPSSLWSESLGNNSYGGGEGLRPLSAPAALEWAERYLEPDEILEAFGDVLEPA